MANDETYIRIFFFSGEKCASSLSKRKKVYLRLKMSTKEKNTSVDKQFP